MSVCTPPASPAFGLPSDADGARRLAERLARRCGWRALPPQRLRRVFLDSADWRLYRRGTTLEGDRDERHDAWRLSWRCLRTGSVLARCRVDATPPYAALPAGPLRNRLDAVLKSRPLLIRLALRTERHTLEQRNDNDKLRLRLHVDHNVCDDAPRAALDRLWLEPVRGYAGAAARARVAVAAELDRPPAADELLVAALTAAGRTLPDAAALPPQLGDAARRLLREQLDALDANLPGVRAGFDAEYLHDYRVALRRTRAALGQLREAIPAALTKQFRPAFTRLGRVTGAARDLDVLLAAFDGYAAALDDAPRAALTPLSDELRRRRERARAELLEHLSGAGHRRLLKTWRHALDDGAPWPAQNLKTFADARVRRVYRRALREGRAIDAGSPLEALHELRKTGKKLRYLLEFFRPLYPAKPLAAQIARLKKLLSHLGELQDLDTHAQMLRDAAAALARVGDAPAETLLAAGALIDGVERRRRQVRGAFDARFAAFDNAAGRKRFDALCGSERAA